MAAFATPLVPIATTRDFSSFLKECDSAPRIKGLQPWFEATCRGVSGRPFKKVDIDKRLFGQDRESLDRYIDVFNAVIEPDFMIHHLHASIPYRIEEDCRLGNALLQYSQAMPRPLLCHSLGTGDGDLARSVAELGAGSVETLCCSPNESSKHNFTANGVPPHATFFHGPFHHLTDDVLSTREDLVKFASGFDVIFEDTTFQMYSPNRNEQVAFVAQSLKEDGLFVFIEKFRQPSIEEYERRELQKDYGFKARYFTSSEIAAKGKDVLLTMSQNQVTLDDMAIVIRRYLRHCTVTWNSGNFYTLVASNNKANLDRFVTNLGAPAIPNEFVYEDQLPRPLF